MPTQRTIHSTLDEVARRVADDGIRPPAIVVIGEVVTVATELAELMRELAPGMPSPPLAEENRRT
jgi:uroporphyrin-III C-methyltransferase/precorrin-2 dehydrogenase/sirohydrochlorin ferrochelatase